MIVYDNLTFIDLVFDAFGSVNVEHFLLLQLELLDVQVTGAHEHTSRATRVLHRE